MPVSSFSISDLRDRPAFASTVADRVWRAWWKPKGDPLSLVEDLVQRNLNSDSIPFALVAHDGERFLGTVSVIASDLDTRPHYTPWIAAVWVDPAHRSDGVGSTLVKTGADKARGLGFDPIYLCALSAKHGFYRRLGWTTIEENVTVAGLAVFRFP